MIVTAPLTLITASEVIALRLRGLPSPRPYLYTQIFAGIFYIMASGFMLGLWFVLRRRETAGQC